MTTGVDLSVETIKIPDVENTSVELYLFDTSGSSIYKDLRPTYWSGTSMVLAVYDQTNRSSFTSLSDWLQEVKQHMPYDSLKKDTQCRGLLVATRSDQSEFQQVKQQEALAFAHQHGLAYFETSAATGKDVDVPFNFLAAKFHEYYEQKLKEVVESID